MVRGHITVSVNLRDFDNITPHIETEIRGIDPLTLAAAINSIIEVGTRKFGSWFLFRLYDVMRNGGKADSIFKNEETDRLDFGGNAEEPDPWGIKGG